MDAPVQPHRPSPNLNPWGLAESRGLHSHKFTSLQAPCALSLESVAESLPDLSNLCVCVCICIVFISIYNVEWLPKNLTICFPPLLTISEYIYIYIFTYQYTNRHRERERNESTNDIKAKLPGLMLALLGASDNKATSSVRRTAGSVGVGHVGTDFTDSWIR